MEIAALVRIEADEPLGCQQRQGRGDRRLWQVEATCEVGTAQIALPGERPPDPGQGGIDIALAQSRKQLTFAREAARCSRAQHQHEAGYTEVQLECARAAWAGVDVHGLGMTREGPHGLETPQPR